MPDTYGNNGNRWWVGENITNQNSLRTSNFFSNNAPSGYQSFPSGDAADDAQIVAAGPTPDPSQPGATVKNLHAIDWVGVHGPYPSQKAANAAIPAIQKANPAPGAVQQATTAATTGWTHNIEQWLVRGFEMLLGAALIVIGLAKLASDTPAGKAAIKIGTKAALL